MDEPPAGSDRSHIFMQTTQRTDFLIPLLTVVSDAAAVELSFLLAYWIRFRTGIFESFGYTDAGAPVFTAYLLGSAFIVPVWLLLFRGKRMYGVRRNVTLADELINVVKVVSLGMLIVMSAAFFYRGFSYSRIAFGLLWILSISSVFGGRVLVHAYERRLYRRGLHLQQAVIIGKDTQAGEIYARLNRHPSFGFSIAGYFADSPAIHEPALAGAAHLGPVADAPTYIRRHGIELAFIALGTQDREHLLDLVGECEGINIDFMMVPDLLEVLTSRVKVKELQGIPFLQIKSVPFTAWGRITKRAFDLVTASLLLVILSPLWLLIMLLIRLDSRGPVFFPQRRVGLDGSEFTMYKFRSMRVGSEQFDEEAGLGIKEDPRRTRIGRILRKASLDELPQLLNVLSGEMSLVGPRPERTRFVKEFQRLVPKYPDRHRVKTGMTGWAQVNGLRGDTSLEERIKYDLYYIENWSLAFDIKILARTLRAAFSAHNSH